MWYRSIYIYSLAIGHHENCKVTNVLLFLMEPTLSVDNLQIKMLRADGFETQCTLESSSEALIQRSTKLPNRSFHKHIKIIGFQFYQHTKALTAYDFGTRKFKAPNPLTSFSLAACIFASSTLATFSSLYCFFCAFFTLRTR